MNPLPMNWQRVFLDTLSMAIEMGSCHNMSHLVAADKDLVERPQFSPFRAEYEALKSRVAEALAFEEINGPGSRLNMEHPLNQRLLKMGYLRGQRPRSDDFQQRADPPVAAAHGC